jgi:hypothetical protein
MSFKYNTTLPSGINLPEAYVRIESMDFQHSIGRPYIQSINVTIHKDAQAKIDGMEPISYQSYQRPYDDSETSSIALVYLYLKSLPEFAGAIDV